ncbi:MAG: hypothetical protein DLM70_05580 [Chloroflexi bacterium]|nr:MAG: hypothetical protein DLM70_05580 [Chloroflexota bacterium]
MVGSVTGNVSQQLLQEWRETRADRRERQRERCANARTLRDAKRAAVVRVLDDLFDAADIVVQEADALLSTIQNGEHSGDNLSPSDGLLYSPKLGDTVEHFEAAVLVIRRNGCAPGSGHRDGCFPGTTTRPSRCVRGATCVPSKFGPPQGADELGDESKTESTLAKC